MIEAEIFMTQLISSDSSSSLPLEVAQFGSTCLSLDRLARLNGSTSAASVPLGTGVLKQELVSNADSAVVGKLGQLTHDDERQLTVENGHESQLWNSPAMSALSNHCLCYEVVFDQCCCDFTLPGAPSYML